MTASRLSPVAERVLKPLMQNLDLFLFAYLGNLIIVLLASRLGVHHSLFLVLLCSFFDGYLFCLGCYGLGKWVKRLFYALLFVLFFFETFLLLTYGTTLLPYVLRMCIESDSRESSEYLQSTLRLPSLWYALTGVVALLFLMRMGRRALRRSRARTGGGSSQGRVIRGGGMLLLLGWLVFSGVREVPQFLRIRNAFVAPDVLHLEQKECRAVLSSTWLRLLYALAFNHVQAKELGRLEASVWSIPVDGCSFKSPVILLVIGESYNKYHTPLYNPESLPTTPRLCRRAERGELFPFTDAVSVSNSTATVFESLFSTGRADGADSWTNHTLFPALFKKAGYEVWFLSNQYVRREGDSFYDMVGASLFNYGGLEALQFTLRNKRLYPYDGELMQELDTARLADGKPKLVIVHLVGQHVNYEHRYPAGRGPFRASDVRPRFGGERAREVAMHYANAVHYNDEVVDSLFSLFSPLETIAVYLSDHGEEVFDYRDFFQRSYEPCITREVAKFQYEVPFFIYASPAYQARHADVMEQIRAAQSKPFLTDDLAQLLLYLGGIECREYVPSRNLLSPTFDTGRKRIIRGDTDYDALMDGGRR